VGEVGLGVEAPNGKGFKIGTGPTAGPARELPRLPGLYLPACVARHAPHHAPCASPCSAHGAEWRPAQVSHPFVARTHWRRLPPLTRKHTFRLGWVLMDSDPRKPCWDPGQDSLDWQAIFPGLDGRARRTEGCVTRIQPHSHRLIGLDSALIELSQGKNDSCSWDNWFE
jgi:hypothetical protein